MAGSAPGAHAADFNGDGIDDLLFRDRTRGDHRLGLVLGAPGLPAGGESRSLLLSNQTLRQRGFEVRVADFDGDGHSDVLDRDLEDGRIRVRLMDGVTVRVTGGVKGAARRADIQAVADFTGDGRDDVLLRGGLTGAWTLYAMWGARIDEAGSGELAMPVDFAWRLNAAGDFNGDGRADLLLRRADDTLRWRMVLFDGTRSPISVVPEFLPPGVEWQLESVRDLNGDHREDLLFRHRDTGAWHAWHLDGAKALPSSGPVTLNTGLSWQLQGLEDLNGDNTLDAVNARQHPAAWRVDFLQGSARLGESGPIAVDSSRLRVAGSGDFDGDGARELLVSADNGWQLMDVRDPAAPRIVPLDLPSPRAWPLVCDPPLYRDFGPRPRPADAADDTAFLTWVRPATRENGEALCAHELSGYRVQYYREGANKVHTLNIADPRADSRLLGPLLAGTWYFRILSVDSNGYSSQSSAGIAKTIR